MKMRRILLYMLGLVVLAGSVGTSLLAGTPPGVVPEISGGTLASGLGLLTGGVLVLRARLGPDVQLMAAEAFGTATALLAGAAAEGMTLTQPGPLTADLLPSGKRFVAAFTERFGTEPSRFAVAAAAKAVDCLDPLSLSRHRTWCPEDKPNWS